MKDGVDQKRNQGIEKVGIQVEQERERKKNKQSIKEFQVSGKRGIIV